MTWACRERVEPCLCPRDPFHARLPTVQHHISRRPRMLHIACLHCAPLAPLNSNWPHEAMTFGERMGWLPFALVMSLSLLRAQLRAIDVTGIGVLRLSPVSISISPRNICSGSCFTERGSCMHSHSHWQRLDHLFYYLSILLGPMVALWRNVYRFVALDTT